MKRIFQLRHFCRNSQVEGSQIHFQTLAKLKEKLLLIYFQLRFSPVQHAGKRVHYSAGSPSLGYTWIHGHVVKKRTPSVSVHKGFSV